jgi:hypothetical protein
MLPEESVTHVPGLYPAVGKAAAAIKRDARHRAHQHIAAVIGPGLGARLLRERAAARRGWS